MENDAFDLKEQKRHAIELNDKELTLLEMLLRRVKDQFYDNYRLASKKRDGEKTPEQEKLFVFYRDAALISERLQERFADLIRLDDPNYNFDAFESQVNKAVEKVG